jgi:type IV pili sensor histidine kinase/response regulator
MKTISLAIAIGCLSSVAVAEPTRMHTDESVDHDRVEIVSTGRYSYVENIPPVDQLNPLKVVIRTKIPQSINSVGQTIEFLLTRSGYMLADPSVLSAEAKILLDLPLPEIHRQIGPMTLDRALVTLAGTAFELVVDPVHRKVAFELSSKLVARF